MTLVISFGIVALMLRKILMYSYVYKLANDLYDSRYMNIIDNTGKYVDRHE